MVRPLEDIDLYNEIAAAGDAAEWRVSELEMKMVMIGRLAVACCSDLQGYLSDPRCRLAFDVLERIKTMSADALKASDDSSGDE